jgi:hypothetical protein
MGLIPWSLAVGGQQSAVLAAAVLFFAPPFLKIHVSDSFDYV